jgi:TetR/AcrR family transcriptional regulator, mexJK operon transcriptional repressor
MQGVNMSLNLQVKRGRPRDLEKRAAIIAAARNLFFEHGLENVKMDHVAADADVSKMTVYKNFPDKSALFEAVVNAESHRIELAFERLEIARGDIKSVLSGFGETLLQFLFSPEVIRIDRVLSAEMARHPELGQRFYRAGPLRMWEKLTLIIELAAKRGELNCDNPKRAAESLIALWLGMRSMQSRFEDLGSEAVQDISQRVANGVEMFLTSYVD